MARLRFPGRPGYRFDRLGVRYGAEEARNVTDPSLAVVASIHRGLMLFRELFGESDEDEEFPGFTVKDVRLATKKLAAVPEMQAANKRKSMVSPVHVETDHATSTRMAQAKNSLESLPASERTRNRVKTVVRKSYKNMLDQGLAKPSKSHFVASIKELDRTLNSKDNKAKKLKKSTSPQSKNVTPNKKELTKIKNIKIRFKADGKGAKIVRCRGRPSLFDKPSDLLEEYSQGRGQVKPLKGDKQGKQSKQKVPSDRPFMPHKGPGRPPKVLHVPYTKQTDKSRAKHLLAKAKKGPKSIAQNFYPEKHPRKTFILPTQSSRSSRVIKPNKRFLEEDNLSNVSPKKSRLSEPRGITSPLFVNVDEDDYYEDASGMWSDVESPALSDQSASTSSVGFQASNSLADEQKTCLFEQPLIVSGKRQWKPSLKVRMKLGGDDTNDFPRKSDNRQSGEGFLTSPHGSVSPSFLPTSPFSEPRFGLFSQMGALGMSAKGAAASRLLPDREVQAEAKKRSGNNILRRAKLQLNRAALNRSKAALAKKLKADMKKEAKIEERRQKQHGPLSPLGTISSLHLRTTSPKPGFESPPLSPNLHPIGLQSPYRRDGPLSPQNCAKVSPSSTKSSKRVCSVCGNPSLIARTGLYFGVPSCVSCSKFYRAYLLRVEKEDISCDNNGLCDISYKNKMVCPVCRFRKCVSVFPKLPHARKRDGSTKSLSHAKLCKLLKKGSKDALQAKLKTARDKERLKRERLERETTIKLENKRGEDRHHKAQMREKKKDEKRRKSDADKSHSDSSPLKSPGKTPHKQRTSLSPSKRSQGQETVEDEVQDDISSSPVKDGRGPRIKHVCRKAAVVLGKPVATFPKASELRLSALPKQEKVKILKEDEMEKSAQGSDDELTLEQMLMKAQERKEVTGTVKKTPQKTATRRVLQAPGGARKRKQRCNECDGCLASHCGHCIYCLDKPRFGGNNRIKQACLDRRCKNPRYTKEGTKAFIKPRSARFKRNQPPSGTRAVQKSVDSPDSSTPLTTTASIVPTTMSAPVKTTTSQSTSGQTVSLYTAQIQAEPNMTGGEAFIHSSSVGEAYIPRGGDLNLKKLSLPPQVKFPGGRTGKEKAVTGSRLPTILPVLSPLAVHKALPQWSVGASKDHRIKAEFREAYDVETAWSHGLALITSGPICLRTVCFLCGSGGKHEMLFCCVCCEPFHTFCLEEDEQPSEENTENWCCKNCQYCNVCGRQDKLLRCDKCENTYHAECLGPNYPTKPSKKKNIWVCTKCVRCKSCGATTPGVGSNATWTYDFSLCYECGKLMDRGNYCPICCKCYSDDDWESKMVQCSLCESWVHAKCEGLSDEKYELLSNIPEDIVFTCSCCTTQRPPLWEQALKEEMARGLSLVLAALWTSKCSQHLIKKSKALQESLVPCDTPNCASTNTLGYKMSQPIEGCVKNPNMPRATKDSDKNVEMGCDKNQDLSQVRDEMFAQYVGPLAKSENMNLAESCDVIVLGEDKGLEKMQTETKSLLIEPVTKSKIPGQKSPIVSDAAPISTALMAEIVSASALKLISDTNCASPASETTQGPGNSNQGLEENKYSEENILPETVKVNSSVLPNKIQEACEEKDSMQQISVMITDQTRSSSQEMGPSGDNISTSNTNKPDNTQALTVELPRKGHNSVSYNKFVSAEEKDTLSHPMKPGQLLNQNTVMCNSANTPGEQKTELKNSQISNEIHISTDPTLQTENRDESEKLQTEKEITSATDLQTVSGGIKLTVDTSVANSTVSQHTILNTNSQKTEDAIQEKYAVAPIVSKVVKPLGARLSLHQLKGTLVPKKVFPHDFESIKQKLYQEAYNSVEDFNEDMVMIIQSAIGGTESQRSTARKKANNSVRSIYVKQMEKFFPWFIVSRCSLWEHNKNLPEGLLPNAVLPPYVDHEYAQWLYRPTAPRSPQPSPFKKVIKSATDHKIVPFVGMDEVDSPGLSLSVPDGEDSRQCLLCSVFGDGEPNEAGRLLFAGQDDWIHLNCALWSAEVFEETDGSLQNVHDAWFRGKQLKCDVCLSRGATVGCCTRGCKANFHFMCARKDKCVFQEDKKVFCKAHRGHVDGVLIKENDFDVLRRVCIDMDDIRLPKKSWSKGLDPSTVNAVFGSCTVEYLGQLSYLSDRTTCLLPVLFTCTRMYWSTLDVRKRCLYTCRIIEVKPNNPLLSPEIVFKEMRIVHDQDHPDFLPVEKLDPCVQSYLEASSLEQKRLSQTSILDQTKSFTEKISSSDFTCTVLPSIEDTVPVPPILSPSNSKSQLSQSWPGTSKNKPFVDYSLLSPTTLKHLNIDISKISEPRFKNTSIEGSSLGKTDFGDLTKVVSKLNQAAADNSSRQKRASSVELGRASSLEKNPDPQILDYSLPISINVPKVNDVVSVQKPSLVRSSDNTSLYQNLNVSNSVVSIDSTVCTDEDDCVITAVKTFDGTEITGLGLSISEDVTLQSDPSLTQPVTEQPEDVMYVELPAGVSLPSEENEELQLMIVNEEEGGEFATVETPMEVESSISDDKALNQTRSENFKAQTESLSVSDERDLSKNFKAQAESLSVSDEKALNQAKPENFKVQTKSLSASDERALNLDLQKEVCSVEESDLADLRFVNPTRNPCIKTCSVQDTMNIKTLCTETNSEDDINFSKPLEIVHSQQIMDESTEVEKALRCQQNTTSDSTKIKMQTNTNDKRAAVGSRETEQLMHSVSTHRETSFEGVVVSNFSGISDSSTCENKEKINDDLQTEQSVRNKMHVTGKIDKTDEIQTAQVGEEASLESTKLHNESVTSEKVKTNVQNEIQESVAKTPPILNNSDKNIVQVLSSCKPDLEQKLQENDVKGNALSKRNIFDVLGFSDKMVMKDTVCATKGFQTLQPMEQKSSSMESLSKICDTVKQANAKSPASAKVVRRRHTVEKCEEDKKKESPMSLNQRLVPIYTRKGDLIGQSLLVDGDSTQQQIEKSSTLEDMPRVKKSTKTYSTKLHFESPGKTASTCGKESQMKDNKPEKNCIESEIKPEKLIKEDYTYVRSKENVDSKDEKNISMRSRHFSANDCDKVVHIGEPQFLKETAIARAKSLSKGKSVKNSQPLKTYPLRRTARRMCDEAMARAQLSQPSDESHPAQNMVLINDELVESEESSSTCSEPPVLKTLGLRKVKGEAAKSKHQRSESHPPASLPLHDMIALKIKAHSLAKSAPGKEGPFKCPICKRLYRTKESFNTHVEACDFEVSSDDDEDEDERTTTENKKLRTPDKSPAEVPVKRGRGRPPKRKINVSTDDQVNAEGERSDSPVFKKKPPEFQTLNLTPYRGRGRPRGRGRGRPCGSGILKRKSLSDSPELRNSQASPIKKTSSPRTSPRLKGPSTKKRLPNSPLSGHKIYKRLASDSASKDNPVMRKLRSRISLVQRVRTPFKEKKNRALGFSSEYAKEVKTDASSDDEVKLCELTGNVVRKNIIVEQPGLREGDAPQENSSKMKCETGTILSDNTNISMNVDTKKIGETPSNKVDIPHHPNSGQNLGDKLSQNETLVSRKSDLITETPSTNSTDMSVSNKQSTGRSSLDSLDIQQNSGRKCLKSYSKNKVVELVDLTVLSDTEEENSSLKKFIGNSSAVNTTVITEARKADNVHNPPSGTKLSTADLRNYHVVSPTEIVVYPKTSLLPKYANSTFEHKGGTSKAAGGMSSVPSLTMPETVKEQTSLLRKISTPPILKSGIQKQDCARYHQNTAEITKTYFEKGTGMDSCQLTSASTTGSLKPDYTKVSQSLTKPFVADKVCRTTLPKSPKPIKSKPCQKMVPTSPMGSFIEKQISSILRNAPKGLTNVTIVHQPPGTSIQQLTDIVHQPPNIRPKEMNFNYLGSFVMNSDGQMSLRQNSVPLPKPSTIHQAVPTYSVSPRVLQTPTQFTLTNPQPVGGTILSPVDASSLIQQVISNQVQPTSDGSLATVNQLKLPLTHQTPMPLGQMLSPVPLHQGVMSAGQILQPVPNIVQDIPAQHGITNTLISSPAQNVMFPPVQVSVSQALHNSFQQVPHSVVSGFSGSVSANLVQRESMQVQPNFTRTRPCTVQLQGISASNLLQPQQNMYLSNSTPLVQNNVALQPIGLAQGYSQPSQMLSETKAPSKLEQASQFVSRPCNLQQGFTQSYQVNSKPVLSDNMVHISRGVLSSPAPLSGQITTSNAGHSLVNSSGPVSWENSSRRNLTQEPVKSNLKNASILKILMPSSSTTAPFVSALSKNSAINILKELADKGSTVRTTASGPMVSVNATHHPKLRNMLHNIEDTIGKAASLDQSNIDHVSSGRGASAATTFSGAQLPVGVNPDRLTRLNQATLRRMLQESSGPFQSLSTQTSLFRQQSLQNRTSSQLIVKKALKHKIASKPSILCRKKQVQNLLNTSMPVKRVNLESCLEKNGIKTGYRREMSCQEKGNLKLPDPQFRAPATKPARKSRLSAKKGRVPKIHTRPSDVHRPIAIGRLPSHPMIHSQRDLCVLPQATLEEEVIESPLIAPLYGTEDPSQREKRDSLRDKPHLMFEITSDDGFSVTSPTMEEAWRQVTEKVQDARDSARLKQLSFSGISGISMFGVNHPAVVYLTEQLYGARNCHRYKFQYFRHSRPKPSYEPAQNPSGCIRCEPFASRKPYDMFSFLMSHYRNKPYPEQQGPGDEEMALKSSRRATSMDLPMAMRFRHLQEHSREAVGVYRSVIHGRGLFCKRNIDGGEMVIEYTGEVIRSILTDKREKYYESKGIGCYMFRIDDVEVVDATVHGSAARFINHSCDPNCYSKVINVDGKKHIVIFAMRPIKKGEELTYDYKFPIEEVKIPCSCGSKRCRKYLN